MRTDTTDARGNRTSADAASFTDDWRDRLVETAVGSTTVDDIHAGDGPLASRDGGLTTTDFHWVRLDGLAFLVQENSTA